MALDRGIRGSEGAATNDNSVAHAATEAYRYSEVHTYNCVFMNKATPDGGKSDAQLNNELNSAGSIYGSQDTTSGAVSDLQRGIKSDGRTRHDLMNAIQDASSGDVDSAMKHLRQASTDLNDAGSKIDNGLSKLGDGGQSEGSQTIQRAMKNEADCSENIQKAEQLLRDGDTDGAIKAMQKGIREVAHRQHQTRDGIASIQGDSNQIDWQNFGPESSGTDVSSPRSHSGNTNTSFYPGFNRGDSYHDSQQNVTRTNNGGWNSTEPFTPDQGDSQQPYLPAFGRNGSYDTGYSGGNNSDYNGDSNPSRSQNGFSLNLPNPSDLINSLPNPSDIVNSLPNPFDMFGGSGSGSGTRGSGNPFDMIGNLPNPGDLLGGGSGNNGGSPFDMIGNLPNPGDLFGGGSGNGNGGGSPFDMIGNLPNPGDLLGGGSGGVLPNPFDMFGGGNSDSSSDSGSNDTWPNPSKGIGSFLQDPAKPIENLITPPKSPKDIVHKILDPIGLFG